MSACVLLWILSLHTVFHIHSKTSLQSDVPPFCAPKVGKDKVKVKISCTQFKSSSIIGVQNTTYFMKNFKFTLRFLIHDILSGASTPTVFFHFHGVFEDNIT